MKKIITLLLFTSALYAQPLVSVPESQNITIDGIYNSSEWQKAHSFFLVHGNDSTYFRLAYDSQGIYILAAGELETYPLFPEPLLSPKHSTSSNWTPGSDWFFHVSATDCESNQMYGDFNNCRLTQSGWVGAPNFLPGPPSSDTVEIFISFNKIGYNYGSGDTLGFAMILSNTFNQWHTWPGNSDGNTPSTWARLVLEQNIGLKENSLNRLSVFPNPAHNLITIRNAPENYTLSIHDQIGRQVINNQCTEQLQIDVSTLAKGTYTLKVTFEGDSKAYHFFKL